MSRLLPDKFVPMGQTVLARGATTLHTLGDRALSVAQLFVEVRDQLPDLSYDAFAETLSALFAVGLIDNVGDALVEPTYA